MPETEAAYCVHCGQDAAADHDDCLRTMEWEPPRYCPYCARRMVVQVTPAGWSARCVEHGVRQG